MPLLTHYQGYGRNKPPAYARLNRSGQVVRPKTVTLAVNEAAGTKLHDLTGKRNDGTVTGSSVEWSTIPGQHNRSLLLNRTSHTAKVSFSPGFHLGTTFWLAFRLVPTNNSSSYCALASDTAGSAALYYRGTLNKIDLVYSGTDHNSTATLAQGKPHDIVISGVGGVVTFWINGQKDATFSGWPGTTITSVFNDPFSEFCIGHLGYMLGSDGESLGAGQVWSLRRNRFDFLQGSPQQRYYRTRYYAVGGSVLGDLSVSGTGSFAAPVYGGDGGSVLGDLAVSGTGSFAGPSFGGDGGSVLGDLAVAGTGAFDAPFTLATLINSRLSEDASDPFEIDAAQAQVTPL